MSLKANISLLEGLRSAKSKAWLLEATFRENTQVSSIVRGYDSGTVYFGAEFQWPMGRRLETSWNEARNEEVDMLYIRVYRHPLIGANRLVGQTTVVLQELMSRHVIQFTEQLLDRNNAKLPVYIKFDLEYASPDAAAADIHAVDFDYPVNPLKPGKASIHSSSKVSSYEDQWQERVALDDAEATSEGDGSDVPHFGHLIKTIGVPPVIGQTMFKAEEFQILVTIKRASKLVGKPPVNPRIVVEVDEKCLETEIKLSNVNPEYNHFMPFEFKRTRADLLDFVIQIRAINMGNALIPVTKGTMKFPQILPENIIGEFRIDVKTVYEAKNHSLVGKRAVLIDPNNFDDGKERGRVSLSIQVQDQVSKSKSGMRAVAAAMLAQDDSSDDEGNLLLSTVYPSYCSKRFGIVALYVKIFQAEDLPRMSTDALATVKQVFNRNKQICDPYVRVSFCGHTARTDTKRDRYDPVWNQQITIVERWPPLCNRIRIGVYDSSIRDECIATHFISLPEIMEVGNDGGGFGGGGGGGVGGSSGGDAEKGNGKMPKKKGTEKKAAQTTDGYLPTFGPSWINLYGSVRKYSMSDKTDQTELNLNRGEGVSYRGRLLVQVSASDKTEAIKFGAKKGGFNVPITTKMREDFLLVGVFFEVGSIANEFCNLPISFEMSIGKYGYRQDGTNPDDGEMDDQEMDLEEDEKPVPMWCHSETEPVRPVLARGSGEEDGEPLEDEEYYCLPYERNKPCLYIRCRYEDNRPRMYITNILETLYRQLSLDLDEVQQYIDVNSRSKKRKMGRMLRALLTKLAQSSECISACRGTGIRTQLDQRRKARIKLVLAQAQTKVSMLLRQLTHNNVQQVLNDCRTLSRILRNLSEDPQAALPDVFLWMNLHSDMRKKKRVAFARIPARQVIHSFVGDERGKDCGRLSSVFLRRPGSQGHGVGGRKLPAALRMYFWLGKMRDIRYYINDLPSGYNKLCFNFPETEGDANPRMRKCPPKCIEYTELSTFEFRAYIFSARKVLRSDDSGLSDVFLRVIINNQVFTTPVIKQTLSPQWDVTIRAPINFTFSEMAIHASPPVIIVEVFDDDQDDTENYGEASMQDAEFLGRCFCKPKVVLRPDASANEDWSPPLLEWWPIYRTQRPAGELLASFELIEMVDGPRVPGVEEAEKVLPVNIMSVEGLIESDPPDLVEMADDRPDDLLPVPKQIRPKLVPYRLEVLIWGLRDLLPSKTQFGRPLEPPQNPSVLIEFGGKTLETKRLRKYSECANFEIDEQLVKHCDIMLPEKRWYWPALIIKSEQTPVDQSSSDAETIYIGNTVVSIDEIQLLEDEKATDDEHDHDHDHGEHEHEHGHEHEEGQEEEEKEEHGHGHGHGHSENGHPGAAEHELPRRLSLAASRLTAASRRSSVWSAAMRAAATRRTSSRGGVELQGFDNPAMAQRGQDVVDDVAPAPAVGFQTDAEAEEHHREHHHGRDHKKPEDEQKLTDKAFSPDDVLLAEMNPDDHPGEVQPEIEPPPKPTKNAPLADWWHRFYLSQLVQQEEIANADTVHVEDEAELLAKIEANVSDTSEADEFEDLTDAKKKKQKKKKKRKPKKIKSKVRRKPPLNPMAKSAKELYAEAVKQDSDEERIDNQRRVDEDFNWVSPFSILGGCLEDEPEYEKFADCLQSFPLYTGKEEDDDLLASNQQRSGTLKAKVCLYKLCQSKFHEKEVGKLRLQRYLPADFTQKEKKQQKSRGITGDIDVTVRVYIIQCINLLPKDRNGMSDPYLLVQLGENKLSFREEKVEKDLNPVFGKMVEFANVRFPKDSLLRVQVYDFDTRPGGLWSDEMLGETVIDLENRLFSCHRGHCGIQEEYSENGCNRWRDSQKPSDILANLCEKHGLKKPIYEAIQNRVTIGEEIFYKSATIYDEKGDAYSSKEPLALHVLHNWEQDNLGGYQLVKEHLESRPLFSPEKPEIEQGRVLMWVDVFPLAFGDVQAPVNIAPREPLGYELRVIIYDTKDVIAADSSFLTGIESTDIYVKGFMIGEAEDGQRTDTHSNSETGEGNFNYRFVFKFKYIKAENRVLYQSEKGLLDHSEPQKKKSTCQLTLKLFDENMFLRDLELGEIGFKLTEIPAPPQSASECDIFMINPADEAYRTIRTVNLFDRPRLKGWFPFMGKERKYEGGEEVPMLAGVVHMELELLTAAAAESDPVGLGREEPHPLPEPNRPERSLLKLLNPLNTLKFLAKKFRSVLIKMAIIIPIVLIFVFLIYSAPGYIVKKILGA